jgi:hypothetical protein
MAPGDSVCSFRQNPTRAFAANAENVVGPFKVRYKAKTARWESSSQASEMAIASIENGQPTSLSSFASRFW